MIVSYLKPGLRGEKRVTFETDSLQEPLQQHADHNRASLLTISLFPLRKKEMMERPVECKCA